MPTPLFPYTWQYNNQSIEVLASNVNLFLPACNDSNKYSTEVTSSQIPYVIKPSMLSTCLKVEDLHSIDPNLPIENLSGWKVGGSVVLQSAGSYAVPLGTILVENGFGLSNFGIYPWKTSGVAYADVPGISLKQKVEPLGLFNTVTDLSTLSGLNYAQITFEHTYNVVGNNVEVILELKVDPCPLTVLPATTIEVNVSFEIEYLINNTCTVSYTGV
jgi:hypothetical protein